MNRDNLLADAFLVVLIIAVLIAAMLIGTEVLQAISATFAL